MNYQEALDELECYALQWSANYGNEEMADEVLRNSKLLQQLIDEKVEKESRKDKLVEGSKWVCELDNKAQEFGNYKPHVENIKKGLIVEVFNVNGLIIFGHDKSMESWVIGKEQFIACFRPLKEGENEHG